MLRREAYDGPITMISADDSPPPDRPNLSKDYLAGTAQEDWIPLRSPEFYTDNRIELMLAARVSSIDVAGREVLLENGSRRPFGALLIATGAEPIHLAIPGADAPHVYYLRSFADSKAIVEKAQQSKRAVVAGGSFIGLEVAASLRNRDIAVDVGRAGTRPARARDGYRTGSVHSVAARVAWCDVPSG
jgi:NAD(P)H-nitrite reductase large subunit